MVMGLVDKQNWLKASEPRIAIGTRDGKPATGVMIDVGEARK